MITTSDDEKRRNGEVHEGIVGTEKLDEISTRPEEHSSRETKTIAPNSVHSHDSSSLTASALKAKNRAIHQSRPLPLANLLLTAAASLMLRLLLR
jgi:hypothetical protein